MAHYAFLDKDNIVQKVITGNDETLGDVDWEKYYEDLLGVTCKRTSYNTYGNEHLKGGTAYRGNYAGIGYTYDQDNDVFIAPKPYESWVLDETKWLWKAPVDMPDDDKYYRWDEDTESWVESDV
jgi:hypothetical protein